MIPAGLHNQTSNMTFRSRIRVLTICAALAAVPTMPLQAQQERAGTSTSPDASAWSPSQIPAASGDVSARVIVKYRQSAQARALAASRDETGGSHLLQAQALGQRHGLSLRDGPTIATRTQVLHAQGIGSAALLERLAADPEVEYAVIDERRHAHAAPNDPRYPTGQFSTPAVGQWYLRAPAGVVQASIDIESAWAVTQGSSNVVVAVLDSGVRYDHPDLVGKLLPGYDFVHDANFGNDGDGWDTDPSDPGDWVTTADVSSGRFGAGCTTDDIGDSLWHGTQTAGLVGAMTGNSTGMASVGRNVMVLPVRVLGKCGGFDSDIIAAMRWAAGLHVDGVPDNPNPARVINLSLGSDGSCNSALYADVISTLRTMGIAVVISAGNDGMAVNAPANCSGVIAVGGLDHRGTKFDDGSLGFQILISAPAGNCVRGGTCQYPILSTSNTGTQKPLGYTAAAAYTTTGGFDAATGTSYSAPLVSGVVALMLSANPALTVSEIEALLRSSATAFPTTGGSFGVTTCHAPGTTPQGECYCTTDTCGAGMLNARAAVLAARAGLPVAAISATPVAQPVLNGYVTLNGDTSTAPAGRSLSTVFAWDIVSGADQARFTSSQNASQATLQVVGTGSFVVRLTVTDSVGATATTTQTFNLRPTQLVSGLAFGSTATTSSGNGTNTDTGGGALTPVWLLGMVAAVLALGRRRRNN